jgi:flagellar protein FlgJ
MKIQNGFSLKPLSAEEKASAQDKNLRDAAKMYENHFLNEMVKAMRTTIPRAEDGLMKPNMAEKIFTEQLDQQYVDNWSEKGGVGLADMIYNQIKEQYFNTTKKDFSHPGGALPISPKRDLHGVKPTDSIQMKMIPPTKTGALEYRFEVPDPSGAPFEAQAPMAGKVVEAKSLGEQWSAVKLDHGRGLTSELTFPGQPVTLNAGDSIQAGQRLGVLDSRRPVLAWKLDWT